MSAWSLAMLPGMFRGIPFHVEHHEQAGGRRGVMHEYPLRDMPSTEDMGRRGEHYRVAAYVLGDGYRAIADALWRACAADGTPGTLVHPYLGILRVRPEEYRRSETRDKGGGVFFELTFMEAGGEASPVVAVDTVANVLAGVATVAFALRTGFSLVARLAGSPAYVTTGLALELAGLGVATLGLPLGGLAELVAPLAALSGLGVDVAAIAGGVAAVVGGYGAAASARPGLAADPGQGLAQLAIWSAGVPVTGTTDARRQQGRNTASLTNLVRGLATAELAAVYAVTVFTSAEAAQSARARLLALLDNRSLAAADAGDLALYSAWQGLAAAALADLVDRAQQLPRRAAYATAVPLPALALAQRLYADPRRAPELVALNGAWHPGFMAAAGERLVP